MLHLVRRRLEFSERQFAGQHFVKDDTERIDVRPVVHLLWRFDLFRRHVMRSAHHILRAGQP